MNNIEQLLVFGFGLISAVVFWRGCKETKNNDNAFGLTPYLLPLGIFVWADAVVLGLFWMIATLSSLYLNSTTLFFLIVSLFWLVRSIGETIYWFNQQFSSINRNPPKSLRGYSFFKNDSIWFVYQLAWQCMTVVSVISSLYFGKMWLF